MPSRYYSYDLDGIHFIVLDLNYLVEDGEYKDFGLGNNYPIASKDKNLISPEQLKWLEKDLTQTDKPSIIFSHQGMGTLFGEVSPSGEAIRQVLEKFDLDKGKKVIACFAGDQHVDAYEQINGIHYFQINSASYFWIDEAAVYSNGNMAVYKDPLYAFVTVDLKDRTIEIQGIESEFLPPAPTSDNYSEAYKARAGIKSQIVKF